jgi:uncharacterized membrane protein
MPTASSAGTPSDDSIMGEARWPMAVTVLAAMVLALLLPDGLRLGLPNWALPAIEGLLLVTLIVGDPGTITRRSRVLRALGIALVAVLVAGSMVATVSLIDSLITGGPETDSAEELLGAASVVWISNSIAFAFLYWELDSGGPAERAHNRSRTPDFAFPQQLSPHLVAPGWRSSFVDYLYLGFTNATAYSPTDAMPLSAGAKIFMAVQSVISLAILTLVVARAVNVLALISIPV